jgi:hypothetical protein
VVTTPISSRQNLFRWRVITYLTCVMWKLSWLSGPPIFNLWGVLYNVILYFKVIKVPVCFSWNDLILLGYFHRLNIWLIYKVKLFSWKWHMVKNLTNLCSLYEWEVQYILCWKPGTVRVMWGGYPRDLVLVGYRLNFCFLFMISNLSLFLAIMVIFGTSLSLVGVFLSLILLRFLFSLGT